MKTLHIISIMLTLVFVFPISAVHAYFDPGTGTMLFQALVAVMATVGVFYRRILNFISKSFGMDKTDEKDIFLDKEEQHE